MRVVDGDTLVLRLDLGCRVRVDVVCRLAGVDAPEVVGADSAAGRSASEWLGTRVFAIDDRGIWTPRPLLARTRRNPGDKYGRWLVTVWRFRDGVDAKAAAGLGRAGAEAESLNDAMLRLGLARPYAGGGR